MEKMRKRERGNEREGRTYCTVVQWHTESAVAFDSGAVLPNEVLEEAVWPHEAILI